MVGPSFLFTHNLVPQVSWRPRLGDHDGTCNPVPPHHHVCHGGMKLLLDFHHFSAPATLLT